MDLVKRELSKTIDDEEGKQIESWETLLERDPALFLERYGHALSDQALDSFESQSSDSYEISFWINHWKIRRAPTAAIGYTPDSKSRNRRLSYMERVLVPQGRYFSVEWMRMRAPELFPPDETDDSNTTTRIIEGSSDDERLRLMKERFLAGADSEWIDYWDEIDRHSEYDDQQLIDHDRLDRYFCRGNSSDEEDDGSSGNTDTGILDY